MSFWTVKRRHSWPLLAVLVDSVCSTASQDELSHELV